MTVPRQDRFVRFPTELLEELLRLRLSGTQWRIVCWVVRQTLGWNRRTTPFTWYRVAQELSLDRGGVVRAGNQLTGRQILFSADGEIGVAPDSQGWVRPLKKENPAAMIPVLGDAYHRKPMIENSGTVEGFHRARRQESSLLRRAKDSSKEKLKTNEDSTEATSSSNQRSNPQRVPPAHSAGAARPIPGKYDRVSKN